MAQAYELQDFLEACKNTPEKVFVHKGAQDDAKKDFRLHTKTELIDFIANDGLEDMKFINSEEFELSKEKPKPFTDAYSFRSGPEKIGYIAFFKGLVPIWNIKSFKLNLVGNLSELKHNPFSGLLKNADIKAGGKTE